jgi:hypothetical protein
VEFRGDNKRAKLFPLIVGSDIFFPLIFEQFLMFLLYPPCCISNGASLASAPAFSLPRTSLWPEGQDTSVIILI